MSQRLKVLLLCHDRFPTNAVADHIEAFGLHSRHDIVVANPMQSPRGGSHLEYLDFDPFDALVIHYSVWVPPYDPWLPPRVRDKVAAWRGPKLLFLQDEYRNVWITTERMVELGIHTLFTLVRPELVERAYPDPRLRSVRKLTTLTGFVPQHLIGHPAPPIRERRVHLCYRSRELPFALGRLGQEKVSIAREVQARAAAHGLTIDVSVREQDRIYGPAWIDFTCAAKAALGTESGASIWDHDGSAQRAVDAFLAEHPGADFETVAREVLVPWEGNLLYSAISPRVFEAAALRTPLVLFPGWYSGVVEPERHYIPLAKDFSNFAEVAEKLKDDAYLQALADRTYEELVLGGRFSKQGFIAQVDDALEETVRRVGRGTNGALDAAALRRAVGLLRRVDALPLGEALLPTVAAKGLSGAALTLPALPGRLVEVATRPARAEAALIGAGCAALLDSGGGPFEQRARRAALGALNHLNEALPWPGPQLLRAAGQGARAVLGRLGGP